MSADISIFSVPYDSGHHRRRMGRGPEALLGAGLESGLAALGHRVRLCTIESASVFPTELASAFELSRRLAAEIAAARPSLPLTLAGNCIVTAGALAAVGTHDLALLWLDAHGDFNTPESTSSGFVDGMALAVICGQALTTLASTIPRFHPIDAARVALVGARGLDRGERERYLRAGGQLFDALTVRHDVSAVATYLHRHASRLYVHLDLDVLDPSEGTANGYAVPQGLLHTTLSSLLSECRGGFEVAGATVSALDPDCDASGAVRSIGVNLVQSLFG